MSIIKTFNKIAIIIFTIVALMYVAMNAYMYFDAMSFAKEIEADSWEITEVKGSSGVGTGLAAFGAPISGRYPSHFMFYDAEGDEMVYSDGFSEDYQNMNRIHYDYEHGLRLVIVFTLVIAVWGAVMSHFSRFHSSGYILIAMALFMNYLGMGWLELSVFLYAAIYAFGIFLIYRARFIDYDEDRIQILGRPRS